MPFHTNFSRLNNLYSSGKFEIKAWDKVAISRADVICALLGRPEAFLKVVFFIPIFLAYAVINFANSFSVLLMCSATTAATSFADLMISARTAFSTVMYDPSSKYNLLGERDDAIFDTFICEFHASLFLCK